MARPKRTLQPHPAPGALRLIQDFVNTRRLDTGIDELGEPRQLRAWLAKRDLLSVDAELHEAEWGAAIAVRELLRKVIRGHAGAKAGSGVAERLNEAFGDGCSSRRWPPGQLIADSSVNKCRTFPSSTRATVLVRSARNPTRFC